MFNRNRHLNIFEHYQSAGTLPIENNISRGFAIILESYPFVLDRFIDYVNRKCTEYSKEVQVSKPEKSEDFDVGFQQTIKQIAAAYSDLSTIVGITLTTADDFASDTKNEGTNSDLITDIVVVVGDAAIVIEVKKNQTNAQQQLSQQIGSLIKELSPQGNMGNIRSATLSGTWEEILISILQNSLALLREDRQGVLAQYLQHLELRYQNWFPIKKLSEIEITEGNAALIDKRTTALIQNCCKNPDDAKKYSGRYIIPIDNNYATEAQVSVNYETKAIEVETWVGDTKSQGFIYFTKIAKDIQWIYDTQLGVGAQYYLMCVRPYFRFAHFQSTITTEFLKSDYCNANYETDINKRLALWQKVSREWKRDEWPKLKSLLMKEFDGIIDNDRFVERFNNNFEQSNRSYVHVSLGFWVTISIPYDAVCKKENVSSLGGKKKDALAELVNTIVSKVMNKIA